MWLDMRHKQSFLRLTIAYQCDKLTAWFNVKRLTS